MIQLLILLSTASVFWVLGYDYRDQFKDPVRKMNNLPDVLENNSSIDIQKLSMDLIKEHSDRNLAKL